MEKKIECLSPPVQSHLFQMQDEAIAEIRKVTGISGALLGKERRVAVENDAITQLHVRAAQQAIRIAWANYFSSLWPEFLPKAPQPAPSSHPEQPADSAGPVR